MERANGEIEVAMMHRVVAQDERPFGLFATISTSAAALEAYLDRRREVGGVDPSRLVTGDGPGGLLVTFDDGYRCVVETALPLLERYEIPCILFVTSGFAAGDSEPYEMSLSERLRTATEIRFPGGESLTLRTRDEREAAYVRIRLELKPRSPRERREYLRRWIPGEPAASAGDFLDPDELRRLDRHPLVTLGAHSVNHPLLTAISPWSAWREIRGSKSRLESWIGHPVDHFAYPYGADSGTLRLLVRLAGFRCAFTTRPGRVPAGGPTDRYAIPRNELPGDVGDA